MLTAEPRLESGMSLFVLTGLPIVTYMTLTRHVRDAVPEWGRDCLGALVRRRAQQLGMPLALVAEQAGLTRAYLHRLLAGQTPNPGVRTLQKLANALNLPAMTIFRLYADEASTQARTARRHTGRLDPQDALIFVADITVPDHSLMTPGERFTKTWAIQNAGEKPWIGRRLVRLDTEAVVARREPNGVLTPLLESHIQCLDQWVEVPPTLPGHVVELSVQLRAPEGSSTVASIWRIEDTEGQACFGEQCHLYCVITVMGS